MIKGSIQEEDVTIINTYAANRSASIYKVVFPGGASGKKKKKKKTPAANAGDIETWVGFLGWEDNMEEGMATYSSILAYRIPMDRGAWQATIHKVTKSQI